MHPVNTQSKNEDHRELHFRDLNSPPLFPFPYQSPSNNTFNSNATITNFGRGAKFPRNYDALPHVQDLLIIHRDISRVNKASVTPTYDLCHSDYPTHLLGPTDAFS